MTRLRCDRAPALFRRLASARHAGAEPAGIAVRYCTSPVGGTSHPADVGSHVAAGAARYEAVFNVEQSSIRFALYKTAAALGGVDTLVFAGGIGEHVPLVRARLCDGLAFPGVELHASRNAEAADVISTDASRTTVRIIRSDEELMIARSVLWVGQQR